MAAAAVQSLPLFLARLSFTENEETKGKRKREPVPNFLLVSFLSLVPLMFPLLSLSNSQGSHGVDSVHD